MINICERIQKQFIYNDKMHIDKSSTKYKLTFTYLKQEILGGIYAFTKGKDTAGSFDGNERYTL
jgi:hypothetical protein